MIINQIIIKNSSVKYAYLENDIELENNGAVENCIVRITVRKSSEKNAFWMHEIKITKKEQDLSSSSDNKTETVVNKAPAHESNLPQNVSNVNKNSLSQANSHPIKRGNYNVMGEEITLDAPLGVKSNVQSDDKSNDFAPLNESVQKNKTAVNMESVRYCMLYCKI